MNEKDCEGSERNPLEERVREYLTPENGKRCQYKRDGYLIMQAYAEAHQSLVEATYLESAPRNEREQEWFMSFKNIHDCLFEFIVRCVEEKCNGND